MIIRWDNKRKMWLVRDTDISDREYRLLGKCHLLPEYYDNFGEGYDVYKYASKNLGDVTSTCLYNDIELQIIVEDNNE